MSGKPTARKAQLPSRNRMIQEANAGRPKGQGKPDGGLSTAVRHNPPDTGQVARPERAPTWIR